MAAKGAHALDKSLLEESLEELYDQAPCGYLSTDPNGLIVRINGTLLGWLNYTREELVGSARFADLLTAGGKIFYDTHFTLLLRLHGAANEIALDLVAKDGQRRPVLISAAQRRMPDGKPLLNRITVFDASERRRYEQELMLARRRAEQVAFELAKSNEQLRRAHADLEQFAYSASHDLKEPLRMMSLYTQKLERKIGPELDASARSYVRFIVEGADRMDSLLDGLLAYTQAARLPDQTVEPVATDEVLDHALIALNGAIQETGAVVERTPLPSVRMEEGHLYQVLQHLITNALKYRRGDPPVIRISAREEPQRSVICIEDNGIGIPPEHQEKIFGLFRRLHTRSRYSGNGIGLAICRKIVERYAGRIWVESSEIGKGSIFCLALPAAQ